MKLKNVSFLELHFEKLLFGFAILVLLGVMYLFAMGTPNAVQIEGQALEPGKIDETIVTQARSLATEAQVQEAKEVLEKWQGEDYVAEFRQRTLAPVAGVDQYKVPVGTLARLGGEPVPLAELPYVEPEFPAPQMFSWAGRIASLAPDEVLNFNTALEGLFAESEVKTTAFDISYASVVATWDTAAVLNELMRKDEEGARRELKDRYKTFFIVDVEVQRLSPRADGSWPTEDDADFEQFVKTLEVQPAPLVQPPGQAGQQAELQYFNPREVLSVVEPSAVDGWGIPEDWTNQERINAYGEYYISLLMSNGNDVRIAQPEFPQMVADEWEEPLSPEALAKIEQEQDEAAEIEKWFEEASQDIERLTKRKQDQQMRQMRTPAPGAGAAAPGLGPGGAARPARQPRPQVTPPSGGAADRKAKVIDEQIARIQEEARPKAARYQELTGKTIALRTGGSFSGGMAGFPGGPGVPFPSDPGFGPVSNARRPAGGEGFFGGLPPGGMFAPGALGGNFRGGGGNFTGPVNPLAQQLGLTSGILSKQELKIWAHDLTARPGQTYRYRMRLRYTNPLFGIPDLNKEQKETHGQQFLLPTKWTGWTEDVQIPRLKHFFVQQASPPNKATVEVWRFYKGQWRTATFKDVRPGHSIGHKVELSIFNPALDRPDTETVDFFMDVFPLEITSVEPPRDGRTRGPRNDAKIVFVEGKDLTFERLLSEDKQSPLRQQLDDERKRLEGLAGDGALARPVSLRR